MNNTYYNNDNINDIPKHEKTKNKLTNAFFELNEQKPIEKIGIKEIVAIAGCHRSTFYEYFSDIYDLRDQEAAAILQIQKNYIIDPALKGDLNVFDMISVVSHVSDLFDKKGPHLTILLGEHGDYSFKQQFKNNIISAALASSIVLPGQSETIREYLLEFSVSGLIAIISKMNMDKDVSIDFLIENIYPKIFPIIFADKNYYEKEDNKKSSL